MLISKQARADYIDRQFRSFTWMKKLTEADIRDALRGERPRPHFKTDPWLHQLVCFYIGLVEPRFLFLLDMGAGKALSNEEKVLTPTGYRRMGDLVVGDFVIGADGRPTKVTGVFPQGKKEVFSVEFSDRVRVECCDDHLWNIKTPKATSYKTLPLKEFRNHLRWTPSGAKSPTGNRRVFIPMAEPVQFAAQPEPELDPYVLGALLGDGSLSGSNFCLTSADPQIVTMVEMRIPDGISMVLTAEKDGCETWSFKGRGGWLRQHLRDLGVNTTSHFKKIPSSYLVGSVESRKLLLAGLLDTDGCVTKQGGFEFGSVSEELADGVLFLVQSLGGSATKTTSINKFGTVYRISGRTPHNPFKLNRKKAKYSTRLAPYRSVESVTSVGAKECTCITVENQDGLFLTNGCVVTHNSKLLLDLFTHHQRATRGRVGQGIITVPRRINLGSWLEDIERHSDLSATAILATHIEEKLENLMDADTDLVVVDYQSLVLACCSKVKGKQGLKKDEKKLKHVRSKFGFFGIDEIHKLKRHDSLWCSIVDALQKEAPFCYGTTGTLFGKDPEDLFSQYRIIDRGETFGSNLGLFRATFYDTKPHPWKREERTFRKTTAPLLNSMIQNYSIRYGEREFSTVPEPIPIVRRASMSEEQHERYLQALEGLINAGGSFRDLDAQWFRMRQITSGYLGWKDEYGEHILRFKENPKLEMLEAILDEAGDSKLVISYEYTETGKMICEMLAERGVQYRWLWSGTDDPLQARRDFLDEPEVQCFVMNSESGGTGLDGLQKVSRYLVLYETPTSPITRRQVMKRIFRPGQQWRAYIYDLAIKGSVDVGILDDVQEGIDTYASVVDRHHGAGLYKKLKNLLSAVKN